MGDDERNLLLRHLNLLHAAELVRGLKSREMKGCVKFVVGGEGRRGQERGSGEMRGVVACEDDDESAQPTSSSLMRWSTKRPLVS